MKVMLGNLDLVQWIKNTNFWLGTLVLWFLVFFIGQIIIDIGIYQNQRGLFKLIQQEPK